MEENIFRSLSLPEKYLFAIHVLFNVKSTDSMHLKGIMGVLTGKTFVDLRMSLKSLSDMGLLCPEGYNWRSDNFDYTVTEKYVIPAMTALFMEEKEMTVKVLKAARILKPTMMQEMLWHFISSDFKNVTLNNILDNKISAHPGIFLPALCDERFAPLLMNFSRDNFYNLCSMFFSTLFEEEGMQDLTYLRSLIKSYKTEVVDTRKHSALHFCDLYEYLANGVLPKQLEAYSSCHRIIAALCEAYKGNNNAAMAHFNKARALAYSNTPMALARKKNHFKTSIVNFLYVLVAYRSGTEDDRKKALQVYKAMEDNVTSIAKTLYVVLNDANITKNTKTVLAEYLASSNALVHDLGILMCHFIGIALNENKPPQWLILKHEAGNKTLMSEEETLKARNAYGESPLLLSIYRRAEWENVLNDLMGQGGNVREMKTARVAYFMNSISSKDVSVRVQTILKNGTWSAGRALSMVNFLQQTAPEMNDADRRIANNKSALINNFEIKLEAILPEMTEESRLYVGTHAPYTLVEVIEEMAYLNIKRTAQGFVVSSNVPLSNIDNDIIVTHTGASSINFVRMTDTQRTYYRRLLSLGSFPLEAEEQLKTFLDGIGGKIEVNSDLIEGGSTMPTVEGRTQLVIQMRPNDKETYAVNVFVRPLEDGKIKCIPGKGDDMVIDITKDNKHLRVQRDLETEKKNLKDFTDNAGLDCNGVGGTMIIDAYTLLPVIEYAQQNAERIECEWPNGARINIKSRRTAAWTGAIKKNENGWFEIEGDVELDQGKVVSMAQLLDLVSQSKGRYIRLGDGEFIALSDKLRKQLTQLNAIASHSHGKVQMSQFSAALLGPTLLEGELTLTEDEELKKVRKRIKEASKYTPEVPRTLNATLRNYQQDGFCWMSRLNKWGAGALLADDMGLGKTIQTITLLLSKAEEGPALVIAPASVAPNWKTELEKFAPSMRVSILNFAENRRAVIKDATAGDVVITTYGLLLSVKDYIIKKHWTTICLDEAHIIKNRGAKTSAVAMQLKSDNRVMLTGTPVQNHLSELWNLFQFVNPGLLGSFEDFNRRFIIPIEQNGDKGQQKELDRLVKPFMLRRTKDKVAKELPEKEEIYQHVTMSEEEMLIYEVLRQKAEKMLIAEAGNAVSMNTLAEITRLRQCACDVRLVDEGQKETGTHYGSKITALVELLLTIIEGFHTSASGKIQGGALVFSQFTSYLELIKQALDKEGIPYLYIDGSVNIKTRQKLVEEFQNGACPVFLISLKAGGLGLNLTRANYVIHMDPWWNPAIEAQATDRAHRIGQKQAVTVYHLIAEGTIEEKIQRLHERKQALVQDILESTDMSHKLTGEDLLEMVRGRM